VKRATLEALFVSRLRALQPDPSYMRLFNAIVRDVWREQEADRRSTRERAQVELNALKRREEVLENACIYEKRIDEKTGPENGPGGVVLAGRIVACRLDAEDLRRCTPTPSS
jgi:hypothetical protein